MSAAQTPPPAVPTPEKPRLIKVGEIESRAGLSRQSVQMYVNMGLIKPAAMTKGGQRLFEESVIDRIALIRRLTSENGYSLKEIHDTFLYNK